MIKTGIFSGSFNPIHIGHLALANWLCEYEGLDEVWFLITPHNPLKVREELMNDALRFEMAQAAIGQYPKFKASNFESSLPQPTYTIDTLRALSTAYPAHNFHFIMGSDNWAVIEQWKEHEALLTSYPILIYPRPGFPIHLADNHPHVKAVDAPLLDISSTFIREAYQAGKDVRFFLPAEVRPYFL